VLRVPQQVAYAEGFALGVGLCVCVFFFELASLTKGERSERSLHSPRRAQRAASRKKRHTHTQSIVNDDLRRGVGGGGTSSQGGGDSFIIRVMYSSWR